MLSSLNRRIITPLAQGRPLTAAFHAAAEAGKTPAAPVHPMDEGHGLFPGGGMRPHNNVRPSLSGDWGALMASVGLAERGTGFSRRRAEYRASAHETTTGPAVSKLLACIPTQKAS